MTEQDILDRGIELIAISFVDGAGLTRAKSITAARAEAAARHGVGASKSLSNFTGEDILATATGYEATGDVRLLPDLDRLAGGIDGWGWAPGDLVDQEGEPWDVCTRSFLKRQVARVAEAGYELRMSYELEWYAETGDGRPVHDTPAYGLNATSQAGSYMREVAVRLAAYGLTVEQIHPEFSPGQMEVSVATADPLASGRQLRRHPPCHPHRLVRDRGAALIRAAGAARRARQRLPPALQPVAGRSQPA